ncbi:MAG TPA: DNA-formamidopyrimidine glycosylase family protein [Acidimicrobiia bacterium]|nr:DNA-formamidopyrimidine glycosylase family protein [Acidimicrobiia bacterium]
MPELPDIVVYLEALERRIVGAKLERIRVVSPSVLRTYAPTIGDVEGHRVVGLRRIGKRIVWHLEDNLFIVIHLMVAGRLRWGDPGAAVPKKVGLAAFDFPDATLVFTEASQKKRASIHLLRGEEAVAAIDPGSLEPLTMTVEEFSAALQGQNRTLQRALTDSKSLSGIGNAYSDEILFRAHLSPLQLTHRLDSAAIVALYNSTQAVLIEWTDLLRSEVGEGWPEKVTAFRPEMAVHGKHGEPCPVCGSPVQRIVYASNETNYCATCQTGGRLLADRARSRLLKGSRPKRIEDLGG